MRQRPETHSDLTAELYMDVAGVIWLTVFGPVIGAASIPKVALMSGHKDYRKLVRYTHLRAEDLVGRLF